MEEHPQARFIVETLTKAGFLAYYAGGWVRDLLLNRPSDDIDIATSAPPEKVCQLFPHTVPIGIAFGIVLVIIEGRQYEVATFREDFDHRDGRRPSRVEFSSACEDAKRRDFTINGMFFDPILDEILDFVGGREDLEKKIIRAIGNPSERIREDRLRMIRGVRFACRFGFQIEAATEKAIRAQAQALFPSVAIERVYQEFAKGHAFGTLRLMLLKLHEVQLLQTIFPSLSDTPTEEIEKRLSPIKEYPHKAPLIAFLLPLFPNISLDDQINLCKRLKLSNLDLQFVIFLFHARELIRSESKRLILPFEWAYFYANGFSSLALQIIGAHLDPRRRNAHLKEHEARIESLSLSIERIRHHNPVVKSNDLREIGIPPGKIMGRLLEEANRIAINEQIHEPLPIIERLKQMEIWPQ